MKYIQRIKFNVAGPCFENEHYMLSALDRNPQIEELVYDKSFFVLHAARQTGKTTIVQHLVQKINKEGNLYALYLSLESVQPFPEPEKGIPCIINSLDYYIRNSKFPNNTKFRNGVSGNINTSIQEGISAYCSQLDRPLVIFFDEADCLSEDTMILFLRQLREGYVNRGSVPFLHSCALIGMRNIRDFKTLYRNESKTLGSASPFNIITKALTIVNFTREQISTLYKQHTTVTGQVFEEEAIDEVFFQTAGQPWLVNAIARECVVDILRYDYPQNITKDLVIQAKENIIKRCDTHIDSLLERLREERVQRILEPLLLGKTEEIDLLTGEARYVLDLGLMQAINKKLVPANNIYKEIIIRQLTYSTQFLMNATVEDAWIDEAGNVDMDGLLKGFQQFWRENGELYSKNYQYKEAAPHLILQAFLQRIVNGGGQIDREYALGRERLDLCLIYGKRKYPIEIKLDTNRGDGVQQLSGYLDKLGEKEGWLVTFTTKKRVAWSRKIYWKTVEKEDKIIHKVGC